MQRAAGGKATSLGDHCGLVGEHAQSRQRERRSQRRLAGPGAAKQQDRTAVDRHGAAVQRQLPMLQSKAGEDIAENDGGELWRIGHHAEITGHAITPDQEVAGFEAH